MARLSRADRRDGKRGARVDLLAAEVNAECRCITLAQAIAWRKDGLGALRRLNWASVHRGLHQRSPLGCERSDQRRLAGVSPVPANSADAPPAAPRRTASLGAISPPAQIHPNCCWLDPQEACIWIRPATSLCLVIGPEGGLSDRDLAAIGAAGGRGLRLGPRILRTETAGLAAISALQARLGDWR